MRPIRRIALCIATAAARGGIGSVNPVITDGVSRFEPRLLGTWIDSASRERVVIRRGRERDYAIQDTDEKGKTRALDGILGRTRGGYILDVAPS